MKIDSAGPVTPLETPLELRGTQRVAIRFSATFAANVLRAGLGFLSGVVVARALGVRHFGDLSFLIASFTAINLVLDMGSSPAFYTFVSRRMRSMRFFAIYVCWTLGLQCGASLFVLAFVLPQHALRELFLGQHRVVVLLAFVATFAQTQIWNISVMLGEAQRRTVLVQLGAAGQALVHVALVVFGWQLHVLTVGRVLILLAVEYLVLAVVLVPRFASRSFSSEGFDGETIWSIISEFVRYCRPLAVYSFVSFVFSFSDRWLLQRFGGSTQQGYYAVGQQFANASLIAAASMTNVFWKETAAALEEGRDARVETLYYTTRRALYFSAAWLSCLLIPFSRQILAWTVGDPYRGAALVFALTLLVPIQQSIGSLQGTFFFATGDTARYTKVGIAVVVVSVPFAYLLLASRSAPIPGLHLGAAGLAAKTLLVQFLSVSVLGAMIARSRGWRLDLGYQIVLTVGMLAFGFVTWEIGALARGEVGRLALAVALYVLGTAVILWLYPSAAGLDRSHLEQLRGAARALLMGRARAATDPSGGSS